MLFATNSLESLEKFTRIAPFYKTLSRQNLSAAHIPGTQKSKWKKYLTLWNWFIHRPALEKWSIWLKLYWWFIYFFALIAEEGFLISSCYSLELCIQMLISFLFSFAFHFSSFTAICKASSDSHFSFLHFFFLGMVLIPVPCTVSRTSVYSSSSTLSFRPSPLNLFLTCTV